MTSTALRTGEIVECDVVGLMEQFEDGDTDHNVLATPVGESTLVTGPVRDALTAFVQHVFDHVDGKQMRVGRFLGPGDADSHIAQHTDVQAARG